MKIVTYEPKSNPRKEYRQQERQRVEDSATLAVAFRDLRSLIVELAYFSPGSFTRDSEIKYTVNLANAKSRFRFNCPNEQCVGGDFDLSAALAKAGGSAPNQVNRRSDLPAWLCQTAIGQIPCHHMLRYKLTAEYAPDNPSAENEPEREGLAKEVPSDQEADEPIWGSMIKQAIRRLNPGFNERACGFRSFNDPKVVH